LQGVKLINLKEGQHVSTVAVMEHYEAEKEETSEVINNISEENVEETSIPQENVNNESNE